MRGDYTRLSFKPGNDYAGVRMQQGRVQLDADFNEQTELLERRLRAGTLDVLGRGAIPRETPDGFRIELTGMGLRIGRGRAYVDGLLAENHGIGERPDYDPALGEPHGRDTLSYLHQPYRRDRLELPTTGTYLVYLDVWQRELTHLGEPDLIEKAVGFDTSTRLQTAWQVKLLETDGEATCDGEVEDWTRVTRPSEGRLTTCSVGVPAADDPCTVPPTGGYRGTENRLYRVEIHDPGPLGKATFKWSRDNGSIASPVIEIDAARTSLTLVSIGRDGAQRLRPGDWIEVTDDRRELDGLPGEMRRIARVEEETQTIELASALPAGAFDPGDPCSHTRVVRWDGSGPEVDAGGGLLETPAAGTGAPIKLEDGVEIAFGTDSPGGEFRSGDWWAFAARTADASVEELHCEPPRGVHHHHCRLAVVDFSSGAVTDCRTLWPPEIEAGGGCDCTVCVSPEEHEKGTMTIQMAVNRVVEHGGGKICLEPGLYPLEKPVYLRKGASVRIQGKGWATVLASTGGLPALAVEGSEGVSIENLTVRAGSLIRDREEAAEVTGGFAGVGIMLRDVTDVTIEGCVLRQERIAGRPGPLIGLLGKVSLTRIRDNVISGIIGIAGLAATAGDGLIAAPRASLKAAVAAGRYLFVYELLIEDNVMGATSVAIAFQGFTLNVGRMRIAGNSVKSKAIALSTMLISGQESTLEIVGNSIASYGHGIVFSADDARIADNELRPTGDPVEPSDEPASGIVISRGASPQKIKRCLVLGNRIAGLAGEGISLRTSLASALIGQNVIERVGGAGISMGDLGAATTLTVENNQVLDVSPLVDSWDQAAGIRIAVAQEVAIVGNTVSGVGREAVKGEERYGIQLWGCGTSRIAGNNVTDVGPADGYVGLGYGIGVWEPLAGVDIADNSVRANRAASARAANNLWNSAFVSSHFPEETADGDQAPIRRGDLGAMGLEMPRRLARALRLDDDVVLVRASGVVELEGSPSHVSAMGNQFEARGVAPCVVLWGSPSTQFAHNRCTLQGNTSLPVVTIFAPPPRDEREPAVVVVDGNHVSGPPDSPGIYLNLPKLRRYTVLGNVVSGPIKVNSSTLGLPWSALNVAT